MSSENTNYDVAIRHYECSSKNDMVMIRFYNDMELLLGDRVIVSLVDGTVYFEPSKKKGSLKIDNKRGIIQICNSTSALYKDVAGLYDLKEKTEGDKTIYYLQKVDELEPTTTIGSRKGVNHPHVREKDGPREYEKSDDDTDTVKQTVKPATLTKAGATSVQFRKEKIRDSKVIELLFKLLVFQIGDNAEALETLNELNEILPKEKDDKVLRLLFKLLTIQIGDNTEALETLNELKELIPFYLRIRN